MPYLGTSTGSDTVCAPAIMADHLHPPVEVAEEFELADGNSVIPVPANLGTMVLEHAVVIAGHDPIAEAILIRNSWGIRWGNGGYAWFADTLPSAVTDSRGWTLTPIESDSP